MYYYLLLCHSWVRWLVLFSLLFAIFWAYRGWLGARPFSKFDDRVRHVTATICHVQFLLGITLYIISPLVKYFLSNFKEAMHQREFRFFGMEHITVMFIAIAVISTGSSLAKRQGSDRLKFKKMAIYYSIGLFLILTSIPWQFSPLTSRPLFRW